MAPTQAIVEEPKWSNPDPYAALPPTIDNNHKRKDYVQLIRKAKADAGEKKALLADTEDFISLDFGHGGVNLDEDELHDDQDDERDDVDDGYKAISSFPPVSLPPRPSYSHLDNLHPDRFKASSAP